MSQKPEILMLKPYASWDLEDLEKRYNVHKLWEAQDEQAYLKQNSEKIQVIATRGEIGASADLMQLLTNLRLVACFGVGTDAIDLGYAREHGIRVTNTPDVLTGDVADLGAGLLLACARRIPAGDQYVRNGSWLKGNMELVTRVFGKKVGIVGMGRIGTTFARRISGFDCDIAYFDIAPRSDLPYEFIGSLIDLAKRSEFLVITLAASEKTNGIINADVLKALGEEGILINISRGSTVDEDALLTALEQKTIKGAGLDVFRNEPEINSRFMKLDNVVLQPHHASGTLETRKAMGQLVRDNIDAYFSGKDLLTPVV